MNKIIMAVMALALIGGGGYAGYEVLNQKAVASVDAKDTDGEKTAKGEKSKDDTVEFVRLEPLMLPLVDKDGATQMMNIVVTLEIADPANLEKVTHMQPRLTDAYIRDMYGVLNQKAAMPNGVMQVEMIKARLEKATTAILGENVVNDILLQHLQQNPI